MNFVRPALRRAVLCAPKPQPNTPSPPSDGGEGRGEEGRLFLQFWITPPHEPKGRAGCPHPAAEQAGHSGRSRRGEDTQPYLPLAVRWFKARKMFSENSPLDPLPTPPSWGEEKNSALGKIRSTSENRFCLVRLMRPGKTTFSPWLL